MSEVIDAEIVSEDDVSAQDLIPAANTSVARRDEWSVDDLLAQVDKVKQVTERAMDKDVHYGVIPGTGSKPTLLKPGAERLNTLFRLAPTYPPERMRIDWHDDGHLTVIVVCVETHIPTGLVWGEGLGLCSTREKKYAERMAERVCPSCGKPAIIKGKAEYGGGWVCFKRKGGCGAKYDDGDAAITGQDIGKVTNPDLPDAYNTVLKMAAKRALVAAVLNATAASDVFTQDVEERPASNPQEVNPSPAAAAPAADNRRAADDTGTPNPKVSKAMNAKYWATLGELEREHPRPDGKKWADLSRAWMRTKFQVVSHTELSAKDFKTLLDRTVGHLEAQDVPFGDPKDEQAVAEELDAA